MNSPSHRLSTKALVLIGSSGPSANVATLPTIAPMAISTTPAPIRMITRNPNSFQNFPFVRCQLRVMIPIGPAGSALATGVPISMRTPRNKATITKITTSTAIAGVMAVAA